MSELVRTIVASEPAIRNRSLDGFCREASAGSLLEECEALEQLRRSSGNFYERVRALAFLAAIHRYHLPGLPGVALQGRIPVKGHAHMLERRFEEAIRCFL